MRGNHVSDRISVPWLLSRTSRGDHPPPREGGVLHSLPWSVRFSPMHPHLCHCLCAPLTYIRWEPILNVSEAHGVFQPLRGGDPPPGLAETEPLLRASQLQRWLPRRWLVCRQSPPLSPRPPCRLRHNPQSALSAPPGALGFPEVSMSLKRQAGGPGGQDRVCPESGPRAPPPLLS